MKKKMFVMILSSALFGCSNNTYQELEEQLQIEESVTYNKQVKVIIQTNCVSCHSIGNVAGFRPLTDYYLLKDAILNTNLLDRIQKQNGEPGLMPQTGRMAQNQIDIILQWMADGLLEQ